MKKSRFSNQRWHKCEVHWRDSLSSSTVWHYPQTVIDEESDNDNNIMVSRGYAFHQDKNYLYLALTAHFRDGKVQAFGDKLKIPNGCIIKTYYGKKA